MTRPAVILLSGGLDSATVLAIARADGFAPLHALSFRYGQRHTTELQAAARVAAANDVREHIIVDIDMRRLGGSALTSDTIDVPRDRDDATMAAGIPVTYVPARNTVFLSYALAWAEVLAADDIFIGVNAVDYSGYPDCRPEYIAAWERMANLATRASTEGGRALHVHAPLINLSKADIIRRGKALGVDYSLTHSCYDPAADGTACGHCDSCQLRLRGFSEAGLRDPIAYQERPA
ncbi:MAG: 7-cyano-7-deazaguanine synthase QueC [Planctomycetota bacterium]